MWLKRRFSPPKIKPPFVEPQLWHRVEALTDDLECQLAFYCEPKDYYMKKYNLTTTHSEVLNAMNYIQGGKALDLGCGRGRNSLYLNLFGFDVTAVDYNEESIEFLRYMIEKEGLKISKPVFTTSTMRLSAVKTVSTILCFQP